jgi:hypothetical protein
MVLFPALLASRQVCQMLPPLSQLLFPITSSFGFGLLAVSACGPAASATGNANSLNWRYIKLPYRRGMEKTYHGDGHRSRQCDQRLSLW